MNFSKNEYEKILYFMNNTYSDNSTISRKIQTHLAKLFHFNTSLFWLADNEGNMYNLNFYNFDDKVIWDYTETFKNTDVMHPKKQLQNSAIQRETVLKINETTTTSSLIKSDYYDFVKKHKLIDQMVIYFTCEDTIFGGIGFPRFDGEKPFSEKEKQILRSLATHLQSVVKNSLMITEYEAKNRIFKSSVEPGIIQIQKNKLTFYNETAQEMIATISPNSTVEEFFHKTLSNYIAENNSTPIFLDNIQLKITPHRSNPGQKTMNYNVYLFPKEEKNNVLSFLSKREQEIFEFVLKGYTNEQIANELWISINTVKKHLRNMYEKLGVSNRASLIYKVTKNMNILNS